MSRESMIASVADSKNGQQPRKRCKRSMEELREACTFTSRLLPPRMFGKAVKSMIMQAQMLRGRARSIMQDEICAIIDAVANEREAKRSKLKQSDELEQDTSSERLSPQTPHADSQTVKGQAVSVADMWPLSLFLVNPGTLASLEDGVLETFEDPRDMGQETPPVLPRGADASFVEEFLAPSCCGCGWPLLDCKSAGKCAPAAAAAATTVMVSSTPGSNCLPQFNEEPDHTVLKTPTSQEE